MAVLKDSDITLLTFQQELPTAMYIQYKTYSARELLLERRILLWDIAGVYPGVD